MNATVLRRSLRLQRRSLIGWTIALALLTLVTLVTWPTIRDQAEEFQRAIDSLPAAMKAFIGDLSDVTTGPGFIRGRLFALMFPLLFAIYAIGRASDTIAGEEERGALDLLLAHPNPRARLVLQKAAAIAIGVVALTLPLVLLLLLGDLVWRLELDPGRLLLTFAMLILHTLALGAVALAVGAGFGRKGWALASAAGLAVAGFLLEGLANLSENLEFLRYASTFYYYGGGQTLNDLEPWLGVGVLVTLTVAALGIALALFERRDVGVA